MPHKSEKLDLNLPREKDVLALLAEGKSALEVASILRIKERTVKAIQWIETARLRATAGK